MRPRVYLAGPEVFLPNAREVGRIKATICADHGLDGVFPLDPIDGVPAPVSGEAIAQFCLMHIRQCSAMIANLSPYRGVFCDTGTAFEVGAFSGCGRPILGYCGTSLPIDQRLFSVYGQATRDDGAAATKDLLAVETFGFCDNLMLDGTIRSRGGQIFRDDEGPWGLTAFIQAVQAMRDWLDRAPGDFN